MKGWSDKAPSQRQLRVGEEIRHALASILERGGVRDPDLQGALLTVTEVRVTPDLRQAFVYVLPLGGEGIDPMQGGLNRARSFLRREVSKMLTLKFAPDLHFVEDRTFDEAERVRALLCDPHVAQDITNTIDDGVESKQIKCE